MNSLGVLQQQISWRHQDQRVICHLQNSRQWSTYVEV